MARRGGCLSSLGGCLVKLVFFGVAATAFLWVVMVALNPWALHIGGRSTPLLYWQGAGMVLAKSGKTYPMYLTFWPGKPLKHSGGRREGKGWSADLDGTGWLCVAPGSVERMDVSGTMYGGYSIDTDSLLAFRLLEWRKPFSNRLPNRGFFDMAGMWRGGDLVMDRPNEQGIQFKSGLFIDHATTTLHWADRAEFDVACRAMK